MLPVACAKVWELGIKAKFSITEKMLPVFGKQISVKYFLCILADAENSGSTSRVLTSLYFFFRKKEAGFGLLSEGTVKENAENGGKLCNCA